MSRDYGDKAKDALSNTVSEEAHNAKKKYNGLADEHEEMDKKTKVKDYEVMEYNAGSDLC